MDKLQRVKRQAEALARNHLYYFIFIMPVSQVWLTLSTVSQPFPKHRLKGKGVPGCHHEPCHPVLAWAQGGRAFRDEYPKWSDWSWSFIISYCHRGNTFRSSHAMNSQELCLFLQGWDNSQEEICISPGVRLRSYTCTMSGYIKAASP